MVFPISAAALAVILPLVSAQTFSACNPMEKTDCPANPAIDTPFECDFKTGQGALNGWKQTSGNGLDYQADGAHMTINQRFDSPTIQTNGYFLFGYAEVKTKAAAGKGIVSSIVLQSESLDEVDWEFIGGDNGNVQTNYFGKGNTTVYDRMVPFPVSDPQNVAHTYGINWTAEYIDFSIDGEQKRRLNYGDANGGLNFPQTPMNLRIGIWAGGDPSNGPGTIEWAGGETDFSQAPFTQVLDSVKVINYSPGKEYKWKDQSGSWQSIEVVGGAPDTGSPVNPVATPSSGADAPVQSGADSPGGLGGGNGGDATASTPTPTPGVFAPSATGAPASTITSATRNQTATGTVSAPTSLFTGAAAQTLAPGALLLAGAIGAALF